MDNLCERFLSLRFHKKKNLPHAFTEAKTSMALFKKWQQIQGEIVDFEIDIPKLPESEIIELTGTELNIFIQNEVTSCIKLQFEKAANACKSK